MGPVRLVVSYQQKLDFFSLLHWLLWEKSSRDADCVGSPSSQRQWICSNLLTTTRKVAIRGPREIRMVDGHTWTEREICVACWSGFPLQGVH
jgi:hypothetical protein